MSERRFMDGVRLRAMLYATAAWLLTALCLLIVTAGIISHVNVRGDMMGYLSSLISFLAAVAGGIAAARHSNMGRAGIGLITALLLTILLLTIGFLIEGRGMDASEILSIVSFTFAGCLFGSVFFGTKRGNQKINAKGRTVRMKSLHKSKS